jgi:HAD superfamily hydrolase (TIGR01509 family)
MKPQRSTQPAILFDLDGTLVDTVYQHVIAWSTALKAAGIVLPDWKIHRRVGMSGKSMLQQLFREQLVGEQLFAEKGPGKRKVNIDALEKKHDAVFTRISRNIRVLPGSREILRYLSRAGVRWAIATTGNKKQTKRLLQNFTIPANTVITTGDDVEKAKPSPDVFVLAADRLGVPIENCIVTGDSVWDMLAAARRRALGVGILAGGYSKDELEQSGAFRVYADPADMLLHIEDLGIAGK